MLRKIPVPIKIKIGTSAPPLQKTPSPPQNEEFYGQGVVQQKEPKNARPHMIGAAISGPRIAGGKVTDMSPFLIYKNCLRVRVRSKNAIACRGS